MLLILALSACSDETPRNDVVEVDMGDADPTVDRDAYAKQRLDAGAVTLIDAALPDGVLLPPDHSGPTIGEIKLAERERAAEAREREEDAEPATPVTLAPPPPPVLQVEPLSID